MTNNDMTVNTVTVGKQEMSEWYGLQTLLDPTMRLRATQLMMSCLVDVRLVTILIKALITTR